MPLLLNPGNAFTFNMAAFFMIDRALSIKSRMVLIVPPLLQLMIFAYAATLDVKNVSIAVLNRDAGAESFELLQRFHGSPTFNQMIYK